MILPKVKEVIIRIKTTINEADREKTYGWLSFSFQ